MILNNEEPLEFVADVGVASSSSAKMSEAEISYGRVCQLTIHVTSQGLRESMVKAPHFGEQECRLLQLSVSRGREPLLHFR